MALLDADKTLVSAEISQLVSNIREGIAITKPQLAAAISNADDWLDSNAAAFNSALPAAARTGLTTRQKAMLLAYVTLRRFKVI